MRQVATYHAPSLNRFITKWRQRISTTVQRAIAYRIVVLTSGGHPTGGFQDHDYEAGMEDEDQCYDGMTTPGAGSAPGVQRPPP